MADLVIECLARKIVEHLYARFQVAEKNEKIAELKAKNKRLREDYDHLIDERMQLRAEIEQLKGGA